jgi:hypothetical protein
MNACPLSKPYEVFVTGSYFVKQYRLKRAIDYEVTFYIYNGEVCLTLFEKLIFEG